MPVLWDKQTGRIVSNESADIMRMFNDAFDGLAEQRRSVPAGLRAEIDELELVYDRVNNGVYKAGFARRQEAYDNAFRALFAALAELEERLAGRRCLGR